ncbi:thioredoxin [Clostridium sp. P21]|uniref:Thioredoxin n=1 Tax=Clostridium muellerianum TaxID=2716538 RepID=A0A7Y0EJ92_9CLOT|nr:thioredoxin domain-containing protein [Clostridium muellerianum]NMM64496.1 thioredoxin [Clostridium muellerianum]
MAIIHANENNYDEVVKEGFVIVDLYGENCTPCMMFSKVIEELNYELDFINVVKVNTTQNESIAAKNDVTAVPTILFMKDGEVMDRHIGFMNLEQVKEKIGQYLY